MPYRERNIVTCVVLSIVTCGFYTIFWMYQLGDDLYRLNGEDSKAGIDIVLSIITCGIYYVYLCYKWGKLVDSARRRYDLYPSDDSLLFVILSFVGMSIITYCIIQAQLNNDLIPLANTAPIMMKDDREN